MSYSDTYKADARRLNHVQMWPVLVVPSQNHRHSTGSVSTTVAAESSGMLKQHGPVLLKHTFCIQAVRRERRTLPCPPVKREEMYVAGDTFAEHLNANLGPILAARV